MRIYLDACCLLRPFDDQSQHRVRLESEAVCAVMELCLTGVHRWICSEAIEEELLLDADDDRGRVMANVLRFADERLVVDVHCAGLAEDFAGRGIGPMDALHLALAEHGQCDAFLTTDDQFIRRARVLSSSIRVKGPVGR